MSRFRIERSQSGRLLLGTAICALGAGVYLQRASAQTPPADECAATGKNCSFTISNNSIQKAPTLFKLQAQIAQAKVPVGDAVFSKLVVNVKSGVTQLCTETFAQVRVRSGVLNLEIGRNIQGCQLDDTVAKYNDLAFQVCIGDSGAEAGNCLKPIQLSSVPYAIKASFASQAQESYRSEISARSNYAQRLVADGTRLDQTKLGLGYYDFETPASAKLQPLKDVNPSAAADVKGAFMQWNAVDPLDRVLNVSAKNATNGNMERLAKILLHAQETSLWGKLSVTDTSSFAKLSTFAQGFTVTDGTVLVQAPSTFTKLATFGVGLNVVDGAVNVQAPSTFTKPMALTNGANLTVTGNATVNNGVTVTAGTLDAQTGATFGKLNTSTSVFFQPGTDVDLRQATVHLPSNVQVSPNFTTTDVTVAAPSATTCTNSSFVPSVKICALTKVINFAVGTDRGCTVTVAGPGAFITACGASCTARCF